jgi:hypothetical protein
LGSFEVDPPNHIAELATTRRRGQDDIVPVFTLVNDQIKVAEIDNLASGRADVLCVL